MHVYNLTGIFLTQTIWFSIKALEQKKENTCLGPSSDQKVAARKYIVSHCKKKKGGGGAITCKSFNVWQTQETNKNDFKNP